MDFSKMKQAPLFLLLTVVVLADAINLFIPTPEEALLNFTQLVGSESADYAAQEHTARTADGYMLAVHRVQRVGFDLRTVPVLLMHGMVHSSEDFVRMGRNRSLAYLLANEGFDVWAGNLRTTGYTSHVTLSRTNPAFWNYNLDDLGSLDLPAILETMRLVTGVDRVHYIGYSMGATTYHVMCHARPDLAARVASYTALAPVVSISSTLRDTAIFLKAIPLKVLQLGANLGFANQGTRDLLTKVCVANSRETEICTRLVLSVIGEDYDQFEWSKYPTIVAKVQIPSLTILDHYLQLAISCTFRKYDYGIWENLKRYGQFDPPNYDLTANRAPAAIFSGKNDLLSTPQIGLQLSNNLNKTSPVVYERLIPFEKFNHVDFVWAKDVDKLLNSDVVEMIIIFST